MFVSLDHEGQEVSLLVAAHWRLGHGAGLVRKTDLGDFHSGSSDVTVNMRQSQFSYLNVVEEHLQENSVSFQS